MLPGDFRDDDEAAQHWLSLLRDGTRREQARARTELGLILERRGLLDDAIEAYWTNVKAKVRDRRPYERLAAIYRQRGDRLSETLVQEALAEAFAPAPEAAPPRRPPPDEEPVAPVAGDEDVLPEPAAESSPGRPERGGRRFGPVPLAIVGVVFGLLAVLAAGLALGLGRGGAPRLGSSAGVPARCYDASIRFPGASEPEAAVRKAYAENEVAVDPADPATGRFIARSAPQMVGGWVGTSLLMEGRGETAPTLAEWLSREPTGVTLTNVLLAGRTLDTLISLEEWEEILSWPADSCEGAFVKNPRNAEIMQLVANVVED